MRYLIICCALMLIVKTTVRAFPEQSIANHNNWGAIETHMCARLNVLQDNYAGYWDMLSEDTQAQLSDLKNDTKAVEVIVREGVAITDIDKMTSQELFVRLARAGYFLDNASIKTQKISAIVCEGECASIASIEITLCDGSVSSVSMQGDEATKTWSLLR